MITTLNKIRSHSPCADGWTKLLKYLDKTQADDEPLLISTVIEANGLDDALWCLRAVEGCEKEMRLYAVWCARQVQHLMTDQRSINAIDVAERFAHGRATAEVLAAAWAAAEDAAWDAALAADRDAAWDAALAADRDAARGAALAAAWVAARVAAWDAAWVAARVAAWDAALDAARDAAWDAVWDAAWGAQQTELLRVSTEWAAANGYAPQQKGGV